MLNGRERRKRNKKVGRRKRKEGKKASMTYPISTLFLLKVSVVSDLKNVTGRDGTEHNGITRVQNRVSRKQKLKKERKEVDGDLIYSPFFLSWCLLWLCFCLPLFCCFLSCLFVCWLRVDQLQGDRLKKKVEKIRKEEKRK